MALPEIRIDVRRPLPPEACSVCGCARVGHKMCPRCSALVHGPWCESEACRGRISVSRR